MVTADDTTLELYLMSAAQSPAAAIVGRRALLRNDEVCAVFDEMADLLAIAGDNIFRVRAYRRAAQVVRTLPYELSELHGPEDFDELPGIGADLANKIVELLRTGRLRALEKLRSQVPAGLRELLVVPALGPVRVRALYTGLGVRDIEGLRQALADNRLNGLRGFGPTLRARLEKAVSGNTGLGRRLAYSLAAQHAIPLKAYLERLPGVSRVEVAGSYRRGRDTVGDLDVLVCAPDGSLATDAVRRYPDFRELTAAGPTKLSGLLHNGLQVDIRVLGPESFGAALHYFTGSRDHNIHLRQLARDRGLKLSEYGLFRGHRRIAGATEDELFNALDLDWIAPELREDRGEVEAAYAHRLPKLIERCDLLGDLHVHTDDSDGSGSVVQMAAAARANGLRYIAITDHSKYLGVVHGLDAARLAAQIDAIDALNATLKDLVILKGVEVDILEDGRLALPDVVLGRLDLVVASVHSHFELSEAKQTTRILRALERPFISILGHPLGRLLDKRSPCAFDWDRVLSAAHDRPCFLEINSQPERLDLDDVHSQAACDRGVLLSIASDAHTPAQFELLEHGVRQARRGWVTAANVLNARPLDDVRKLLKKTMQSS